MFNDQSLTLMTLYWYSPGVAATGAVFTYWNTYVPAAVGLNLAPLTVIAFPVGESPAAIEVTGDSEVVVTTMFQLFSSTTVHVPVGSSVPFDKTLETVSSLMVCAAES